MEGTLELDIFAQTHLVVGLFHIFHSVGCSKRFLSNIMWYVDGNLNLLTLSCLVDWIPSFLHSRSTREHIMCLKIVLVWIYVCMACLAQSFLYICSVDVFLVCPLVSSIQLLVSSIGMFVCEPCGLVFWEFSIIPLLPVSMRFILLILLLCARGAS